MKSGSGTKDSKQTNTNSQGSGLLSLVLWPVNYVGSFFSTPINPSAEKAVKEINEYIDSFSARIKLSLAVLKNWDETSSYIDIFNSTNQVIDDFYATILNIQKSILNTDTDKWIKQDYEIVAKSFRKLVPLQSGHYSLSDDKATFEMWDTFGMDTWHPNRTLGCKIINTLELNLYFLERQTKKLSSQIIPYRRKADPSLKVENFIEVIKYELEYYMDIAAHIKNHYTQCNEILSPQQSTTANLSSRLVTTENASEVVAESKTALADSTNTSTTKPANNNNDSKSVDLQENFVRRNSLR